MLCEFQEEFIVPPGYTPTGRVREDYSKHELFEIKDTVRWLLGNNTGFVFDTKNKEYLEFLRQCKEDTTVLAQHLQTALDDRKLPINVRRTQRIVPGKMTMSFLIRPPFFSSEATIEEKERNRMQGVANKDIFIMHLDQERNLQCVRTFRYYNQELRRNITNVLRSAEYIKLLKENYGNWPVFASVVAEAVNLGIRMLSPTNSRRFPDAE